MSLASNRRLDHDRAKNLARQVKRHPVSTKEKKYELEFELLFGVEPGQVLNL